MLNHRPCLVEDLADAMREFALVCDAMRESAVLGADAVETYGADDEPAHPVVADLRRHFGGMLRGIADELEEVTQALRFPECDSAENEP